MAIMIGMSVCDREREGGKDDLKDAEEEDDSQDSDLLSWLNGNRSGAINYVPKWKWEEHIRACSSGVKWSKAYNLPSLLNYYYN